MVHKEFSWRKAQCGYGKAMALRVLRGLHFVHLTVVLRIYLHTCCQLSHDITHNRDNETTCNGLQVCLYLISLTSLRCWHAMDDLCRLVIFVFVHVGSMFVHLSNILMYFTYVFYVCMYLCMQGMYVWHKCMHLGVLCMACMCVCMYGYVCMVLCVLAYVRTYACGHLLLCRVICLRATFSNGPETTTTTQTTTTTGV